MTDQELIARLRVDEPACEEHFTANLAADRIEELVNERDELGRRLNAALYGQPHFAWSIHEEEMADLRAKLAKAVAFIRRHIPDSVYEQRQRANAFLADLEGK